MQLNSLKRLFWGYSSVLISDDVNFLSGRLILWQIKEMLFPR